MPIDYGGGSMNGKSLRRLAILTLSVFALVLALAPAAFAGGCDDDEDDCGGGDSGSAEGGVSTGYAITPDSGSDVLVTIALATCGIVLITAGSFVLRRENR
jgi:hypothetical protein